MRRQDEKQGETEEGWRRGEKWSGEERWRGGVIEEESVLKVAVRKAAVDFFFFLSSG